MSPCLSAWFPYVCGANNKFSFGEYEHSPQPLTLNRKRKLMKNQQLLSKDNLLSFTKAVAPFLICLTLCAVAANAQDSISNLSHKGRSVTQTVAQDAGYIVIIAGLVTAWMRRSIGVALGAIMVGGALAVGSALYTSAQGYFG
jgi:hypothetical protein